MSTTFPSAPHIEGARPAAHPSHAPNAALLIDFDNVTMGIRSDLSKEMKALLNSDVIRGKVTVQRAYADWRRYPQYIVPLSEASVDLIFAPAYGSNKKNATDIRMAIDGMELVFTRPEIGTYILLTGDSDFSSLVLKLKEYGKYVIGVGIQESASDILVQNCDEYYSYTSISGLRKTDESGGVSASDPWALVEQAVEQMGRRGDVMRSDRLKQVLLELDPGFDEKGLGFSKFSKFVSEAARKGLIQTRRMENGQYEILAGKGRGGGEVADGASRGRERREEESSGDRGRKRQGRRGSGSSGGRERVGPKPDERQESGSAPAGLEVAHTLLERAVSDLTEDHESDAVRDSDVKRRMLALEEQFDEATLGFPKFSKFLQDAEVRGVVRLEKSASGNYQVELVKATEIDRPPSGSTVSGEPPKSPLRPREDAGRPGREADAMPLIFEGQIVPRPQAAHRGAAESGSDVQVSRSAGTMDLDALHLPTDPENVVRYLTNSYGGVGAKTAETLVEAFGDRLFAVLHQEPSRVSQVLPPARAELVLDGWRADLERRTERYLPSSEDVPVQVGQATTSEDAGNPASAEVHASAGRSRRGRRTRGGVRPTG